MSDRIGQQLGNYRLVRLLGQGGFADVYLGEHIYLKTPAAIKVLQTRLVQDDLQVFLKEARSIANLIHPNIVRVLEFGVEGDLPFLVMDHAANGTLRQRHPKGTQVPPPVIAAYIKQVASALQYAHEQRLIHRDIKPENMLLGRNNEVLLSDFGIAVVAQSSRYQQSSQDVGGTIAYMAPEQLQGRAVPASDQYSLGIVVYEWLCGERPFQGSFPEIASQHMLATPTPLRSRVPGLSPAIEEVVQRALAKDPQQRFMKVQAFAMALEQAAQPGQFSQSQSTYMPPSPPTISAAPTSNFGTTQPQQGTPSATFGANSFGQTPSNGDPARQGMPSGMYGNVPPASTTPSGNFGAVPPGQITPNFASLPPGTPSSNLSSMQQGTPTGNFTNYPGQSSPNYAALPSAPQPPNPNSSMLPGQFAQMVPGSNQPKKMMSRRTAIIGIAGLVVVIGGGTALALSQNHGNGLAPVVGGSTPTNNTPVNTPVTAPTATPTSLPTDTPTPDPNVTPTPTTVPTVQTTPGTVLYTANWSSGLNGWAGSADWKVLNGVLLNDGSNGNSSNSNGPTIVPPYQLEGINDYAIEAKIQVVSFQNNNYPIFGFAIRGTTVNNSWQGYQNALGYLDAASNNSTCNTRIYTNDLNNPLGNAPFDPAKSAHTYRFEAKGNTLKFYIDGGSVLQVVDNQFLGGAQVGLWCNHVELSVTSFTITAL